MLTFIIVCGAMGLVGLGVPMSFTICIAVANKRGKLTTRTLRLCCLVLALCGATLGLFAYWTLGIPYEESQSVILHWVITLILMLLIGIAASLLAYVPLPRILRRLTFPLAFCFVTIVPFLLSVALFAYAMEHLSSAGDGTETRQNVQDKGIGE